jgi:hypothetical protein
MRGDKRNTREEIRRAMLRIEHRRPMRVGVDRCRMNISVVAREAGPLSSQHSQHVPGVAEAIRAKAVKGSWSRLDAERRERTRLIEQLRRARERLKIVEQERIAPTPHQA